MTNVSTDEKHVRIHRILFDRHELAKIIASAAADLVKHQKPRIGSPGVTFKVEFEDTTEGSPAYKVGTKATVVITEDMMPQDASACGKLSDC